MNGTIGRCAEALGAIGGGAVAATAGIRRTMLAEAIPIAATTTLACTPRAPMTCPERSRSGCSRQSGGQPKQHYVLPGRDCIREKRCCGQGRGRTADLPLFRSFHLPGSTAALLVIAGFLIVWLRLDACGFRPLLARGRHGAGSRRSGARRSLPRCVTSAACPAHDYEPVSL